MCTYANISLQGVAGLAKAQIRAGLVDASSVNARRVDTLVHVFTQKQHFLMEEFEKVLESKFTETSVVLQVIAGFAGAGERADRVLANTVGAGVVLVALVHILTGLIVKLEAGTTGTSVRSLLVDALSRSAGFR